jgi:translation initiation factor eIF-2B subunit delta
MSAKEGAGGVNVPVIVCCETVKFTDRVALDSIVVNEVTDPDELVVVKPSAQVTGLPLPHPRPGSSAASDTSAKSGGATLESGKFFHKITKKNPLENWRDTPNLQLLNIMYDVTPADYIDMVITEMGSLPPSAVPVVHRMSTNS